MDVAIHQVGESTMTNLLAKFLFCDPNRLVGLRGGQEHRELLPIRKVACQVTLYWINATALH